MMTLLPFRIVTGSLMGLLIGNLSAIGIVLIGVLEARSVHDWQRRSVRIHAKPVRPAMMHTVMNANFIRVELFAVVSIETVKT